MHLLYLDESGSVTDPAQLYFVLAGVSVFERKTHWIEQKLNEIAAPFESGQPHLVELHGSPMRSGRDGWKAYPLAQRLQAIKDALQVGVADQSKGVRLFGAVIKKSVLSGSDPVEHAFEQLSSRFDLFLKRLYAKHDDPQRGIMLFASLLRNCVCSGWRGSLNTSAILGAGRKIMRKFRCFWIPRRRD